MTEATAKALGDKVRVEINDAITFARREAKGWDKRWAANPPLEPPTLDQESAIVDEQRAGYNRILEENGAMPDSGSDLRDIVTWLLFREQARTAEIQTMRHNWYLILCAHRRAITRLGGRIEDVDLQPYPKPAA